MSAIWRFFAISTVLTIVPAAAQAAARPDGQVELIVLDHQTGEALPARMHLRNARGRPVRIRQAGVVPRGDHFYFDGSVLLKLSRGAYTFDLDAGPEYRTQTGHFEIQRHADDSKRIEMHRFANLAEEGWWAGDLLAGDVHTPLTVMQAAGLYVLPVWDTNDASQIDALHKISDDGRYFGLDGPSIYPAMRAFQLRGGAQWEPQPNLLPAEVVRRVRESNGRLVLATTADKRLPVYLATGEIDAVAVIAPRQLPTRPPIEYRSPPGRHKGSAQEAGRFAEQVYVQILESGLRLPPAAGSGTTWLDNVPVGDARVYVHVDEPFSYESWWNGLVAGRVFVTNGPLLRPSVQGQPPGHVFYLDEDERLELEIGLNLATRDPVDYLEIVKNGQVEFSIRLDEWLDRKGRLPPLQFDQSGWFLVRAVTTRQDIHQLAMSGPYYVEKTGQPRVSRSAVQFFLDWIEESLATAGSEEERRTWEWARDVWRQRLELASTD